MADERDDSEIVTQFLLNTCRLRPQLTKHAVQAAQHCSYVATLLPDRDVEADNIPLTTGSAAEFYIEPMLPCIGDQLVKVCADFYQESEIMSARSELDLSLIHI